MKEDLPSRVPPDGDAGRDPVAFGDAAPRPGATPGRGVPGRRSADAAGRPESAGPVEAVIFDYGCVLSEALDRGSVGRMAALAGIPAERFMEAYIAPRRRYDLGEIDRRSYWHEVLRPFGKAPDDALVDRLFLEDVAGWTRVREPMVAWARALAGNGIKIAVLSNMPADHIDRMSTLFDWLSLFDVRVFSAAIRLAKPDPAIYRYCLDRLGLPAARCLFIDDLEPNIEAARSVGLQVFHFRSESELSSEVARLGGLPPFPAA